MNQYTSPCIFNGEISELSKITIPINSLAIQYGVGVFETLRTYQNKQLPFLAAHLQRLFQSLDELNIDCAHDSSQLEAMVLLLVNESPFEYQRLKIMVIPEGVLITSVELVTDEQDSFRLTTWQGRRSLANYKTTSYLECHLAWLAAQESGFDDSLLIDDAEQVYETARANIFWVKDGVIYTRGKDVLPGIMRDFVLQQADIEIQFKNAFLDEVLTADEVFITNSIRCIVPVTSINQKLFNEPVITPLLQQRLCSYLSP